MLRDLPRRLDRIMDAVERNELAVGVHLGTGCVTVALLALLRVLVLALRRLREGQ